MKKTTTTTALALALGVCSLVLINPGNPAQARTTEDVGTVGFADAHVSARHPRRNYADSAELKLSGKPGRRKRVFLKFRVPEVEAGAALGRVTLRLHPLDSSVHGVRVYRSGRGWTESTLNWRRMPARRAAIGRSDALQAGTPEAIELDPALVTPGSVLSVRLATSARKTVSIASKEAPAGRATIEVTPMDATPVTTRTLFGACPVVGTSASSVISKFGTGASVRIFVPGGFNTPDRPTGASKVHVSWKPTIGSTITDAQLIAAFAKLKDGDLVEVWHESDVKYRKGAALAPMLAIKNQFHDRVVALRNAGRIPHVLTVNTWAGWSVDEISSVDPANLHARADILGVDMDGIPANERFYPFVARQMGAKFVNAYKAGGYSGWTVPEFTMAAVATDQTRARRVAWFQSEVTKISQGLPSAGVPAPQMIAWFDTGGPLNPYDLNGLTQSNEIAAWSALVAASS